jgi:sulfite exporter TauE/SafE/copper chaperone CopZ
MDTPLQTYTFHVKGMHCASCVFLTETELQTIPMVTSAHSNLETLSARVTGSFGDKSPEAIAKELSNVLIPHGYSLSVEHAKRESKWAEFKMAMPIALGFIVAFVVLQKWGIVNLIGDGKVTYGAALLIGGVASLSTCMAVVGGLLLSMSATFAKEGETVRPQILFHAGRLISFFVLGGVIGTIGSAFQLSTVAMLVVSIVIGVVMLLLGINLLDVFHFAKRLQPSMPKFLSRHAMGVSKINHTLTPFAVGVATFFLPCGFTQSMQIYSLSSGSFFAGGMTMLVFALGTLPVLGLISFSSVSIKDSKYAGVFFKTAGLIVILFAIFNLMNGFVVAGIIPPLFNLQ